MRSFLVLSSLLTVAVARPSLLHGPSTSNAQTYGSSLGISSSLPQQLSPLGYSSHGVRNSNDNIYDSFQVNQDRDQNEEIQRQIQTGLINQNSRNSFGFNPLHSISSSFNPLRSASSFSPLYGASSFNPLPSESSTSGFQSVPYDSRILNRVHQQQPQLQQQGAYGINSVQAATRVTPAFSSFLSQGANTSSRSRFLESPELNSVGSQQKLATLNSRQNHLYSQISAGPSFQTNDLQWAYGPEGHANTDPRW